MIRLILIGIVVYILTILLSALFSSKVKNTEEIEWNNGVLPCPPEHNSEPHTWEYVPIDNYVSKLKCNRCGKFAGEI